MAWVCEFIFNERDEALAWGFNNMDKLEDQFKVYERDLESL